MASYLPRSVDDIRKIPPTVYRGLFIEYLELRALKDVSTLVLNSTRLEDHTPFLVSAQDVIDFDPVLGYSLIHFPRLLLSVFKEALIEVQASLYRHSAFERKYKTKGSVKKLVHVRIIRLPCLPEINKRTISDIRANDFDQFIQLTGTVVRTGSVRVLEVSKEYQCSRARCGFKFTVLADPEQGNAIPVPRTCPAMKTTPDGNAAGICGASNIDEIPGSRECVDYQEIKIQDKMELLHLGSVPRTITIVLEADLADKYNAGDDIVVVGNIIRRWAPVSKGVRCQIELALRANSVTVLNSNEEFKMMHLHHLSRFEVLWDEFNKLNRPFSCRDEIVRAVCPQLHGMYFVKLCLLLTIIGGSAHGSGDASTLSTNSSAASGVSRRSQSHLLIVGDPGTGKSQLLRFAASLLPRSVLTTGVGTTGAGLTCTAVRDGSDWVLEAGALVLANEGVCCIDEFVSIKEQDRACIHEAMEQQTISVAKAGLLVKLNTRATVIAVSNPKGSYDVNSDLTTNTAIASPLLSRFDLVLVLLDYPEKEFDKRISTFLLQRAVGASLPTRSADRATFWSLENLRAYVLYCRENLVPKMGEAAQFILMRYYQMQRQSDSRSSARTTVRLLESLMRLAEAHAKLMFREIVLLQDAVVAISCIELSASASVMIQGYDSALHADFPDSAEEAYTKMEMDVFKKIHYSRERLEEELNEKITSTSSHNSSIVHETNYRHAENLFKDELGSGFQCNPKRTFQIAFPDLKIGTPESAACSAAGPKIVNDNNYIQETSALRNITETLIGPRGDALDGKRTLDTLEHVQMISEPAVAITTSHSDSIDRAKSEYLLTVTTETVDESSLKSGQTSISLKSPTEWNGTTDHMFVGNGHPSRIDKQFAEPSTNPAKSFYSSLVGSSFDGKLDITLSNLDHIAKNFDDADNDW